MSKPSPNEKIARAKTGNMVDDVSFLFAETSTVRDRTRKLPEYSAYCGPVASGSN